MSEKAPPPPSRTQMFAAMKPPPTRTGRVAVLLSCGLLVAFGVMFGLLCSGLLVLGSFAGDPLVATAALVTAAVCATPYFAVLVWLDRNDPEPPQLIASAYLWGAILATSLSAIFNDTTQFILFAITNDEALAGQLTASFSAPFIEESTKAGALLVIYLFFWRDFDNVLDGILYGAFVGLGFATFENFLYYVQQDNGVLGVVFLTILRGVLTSIGSHACFTAFTGASLGAFRVMRSGILRWFLPPMGLMAAMFIHFSWNTFTGLFTWDDQSLMSFLFISIPIAVTVLQLPFVFLVLVASTISLWHESNMITKYLSTEKPPVLLEGELGRLVPARWRTLHLAKLLVTGRIGEWFVTVKRNRRLIRLAFEKWHMDSEAEVEDDEMSRAHALAVVELRKELTALKLPA